MDHENLIERVYDLIDDVDKARWQRQAADDQSAARNLSLAITHLEDAALRIGPPMWYRPNPGFRSP